ncbi:hypothetical protein [Streptomyces sp. NPDC002676]
MAELYALTFEVGRRTPVGVLTGLLDDIEIVTQSSLELATHVAQGEADNWLVTTLRKGGVRGLVQEARRRELPGVFEREGRELEEIERYLEEWMHFPLGRRAEGFLLTLMAPGRGYLPWSRLLDQLRADETSRRLPTGPYRFRSINYRNPLIVEILAEIGATGVALGTLLKILRGWGPYRRQQNAIASDLEDQVQCRIKLRQMLLAKVGAEGLSISPDAINELVSGSLPGAISRLAENQPEIHESDETDEDEDAEEGSDE